MEVTPLSESVLRVHHCSLNLVSSRSSVRYLWLNSTHSYFFISSFSAWDVIYGSRSRYAAVELQLQFLPFHFHSPLLVLLCRFQRYLLVCCSTCIKLIHNKIMKTRSSISTVHMCIFASSSRITCLFCNCAPTLHCERAELLRLTEFLSPEVWMGILWKKRWDDSGISFECWADKTWGRPRKSKSFIFTTAPAQSHHSTAQRDNNLKQFPAWMLHEMWRIRLRGLCGLPPKTCTKSVFFFFLNACKSGVV